MMMMMTVIISLFHFVVFVRCPVLICSRYVKLRGNSSTNLREKNNTHHRLFIGVHVPVPKKLRGAPIPCISRDFLDHQSLYGG